MRRIIIGIDGGGTKTRCAALDARTGELAASSVCGSIHALTHGTELAVQRIGEGIAALGLGAEDAVEAISIGDPSIDDEEPEEGAELRARAEAFCSPGGRCFSKSDVFMALYGLSRGEPAALLVSGTGSMGVAMTEPYRLGRGGALRTVGGWGAPTGDPGSAFDIASSAIRAAAAAFDGIASDTALGTELMRFFGASSPRALIGILNAESADRAAVAAFAPCVERCAEAGDPAARTILKEAGNVLGRYALVLLGRLGTDAPLLGLYGGVLLRCRSVREETERAVKTTYPRARTVTPDVPPEIGAALFAADELGIRFDT